jgi:hypothetical protein
VTSASRSDPEAAEAFEDDVEAAVLQLLRADDPADAADVEQPRRLALVARLDHADQPVAGQRVADHRPVARLEDVQRQLRAREEQAPASGKIGTRRRAALHQVNRIAERRRRCCPGPGILEPDHLQELEQPLARRALVPVAVAADDLEQLVGGASRSPPPSARRQARSAPRDRRDRRRCAARTRPSRHWPARLSASASAERARAIAGSSRLLRHRVEQRARLVGRPAAISARARPEITSGFSGAMSRICSKI